MSSNAIHQTFFLLETVLAVMIIISNGMTIIVQSLNRRLFDGVYNQLILNLTIADLFTGFAYLYMIATFLWGNFSKFACLLGIFLMYLAIAASYYATLTIAVHRYAAIIYPLKYSKYMARRVVNAMIVASWCAAVLISSVPLYWNNFDPEKGNCKTAVPRLYYEVIWATSLMVTWFSIFALYLGIWKATRAHMERSKARSNGTADNSDKNSNFVFLFLGCFSVCWLPYVVLTLLKVLHFNHPSTAMHFFHHIAPFLSTVNGVINPLIYAWKTPAYREGFRRLFRSEALNHSNDLEKQRKPKENTTKTSTM